jgi:hypothetical protein
MLKLVQEVKAKFSGRRIAVLIPEVVKRHWYQHLLHTHRAVQLRSELIALGDPDLTVINVPWGLSEGKGGTQELNRCRTPYS